MRSVNGFPEGFFLLTREAFKKIFHVNVVQNMYRIYSTVSLQFLTNAAAGFKHIPTNCHFKANQGWFLVLFFLLFVRLGPDVEMLPNTAFPAWE